MKLYKIMYSTQTKKPATAEALFSPFTVELDQGKPSAANHIFF